MDDKTLLELAAKAAGVDGRFIELSAEDGYPSYLYGIGKIGAITTMWNPLEDDGDALRLAVKLGMIVVIQDSGYVQAEVPGRDPCGEYEYSATATRRAIVRAAAAIGEQM